MIDHLGQPTRLILEWEPPIEAADRKRWAIGEVIGESTPSSFRYFIGTEFEAFNDGRTLNAAWQDGYRGFPAFGLHTEQAKPVESGVAEALGRRLAARSRSDFNDYLKHHLLKPTEDLTDMALLASTGARLPGDGFALTDPLSCVRDSQDFIIELVGIRHYIEAWNGVPPAAPLLLEEEPENPKDPNAVKISFEGRKLANVNRLQAQGLRQLLRTRSVTISLHRLNGTLTRRRAYAFVQVRTEAGQLAA